jgi:transcriptional regulator with XRE-family HTH domain
VDASKFGKFISDQRKTLGMTQSDLGNMLMVTDKAVSKWERGLGFPDINTLEPLAEALQVSVQELMRAEKNVTTELNEEVATEAILNTIGVADKQLRDAEKRQVRISVLIIAVVAMLVLIVDNMKLSEIGMAALFVYLPIICLIGGIVLLVQALMRKRKGNPYKATLITAIVMVGIVALIILFFFAAGMLGFPING